MFDRSAVPEPDATAQSPPTDGGALVLLAGFADASVSQLADFLDAGVPLVRLDDEALALETLARDEVAVLCLGDLWVGRRAADFLHRAEALDTTSRRVDLVLAAGDRPEIFQDFIDRDRLFYISPQVPPMEAVGRILGSALDHHRQGTAGHQTGLQENDLARRVLRTTEGLAQATLHDLPVLAAQAVDQLLTADEADCWIYDRWSETLWTRNAGFDGSERRESAAAGLVSFVLRTGSVVRLSAVGDDPRYDAEADNRGGDPKQRFLAVPVLSGTRPHRGLAVLVALRHRHAPPFEPADAEVLSSLAEQLSAAIDRGVLQARLNELEQQKKSTADPFEDDIFRRQALEHYVQDFNGQGHLLEISPRWTHWTYRVLVLLFVCGLIFSLVASVHEYADGDAVVRLEGRDDITAPLAGTVSSVEVVPGQAVAEGDLLVRLYGAQEAAELERLEREFELGLINRLRNPADPSVERALGALQAQKRLAEARLEERSVRAPRSGVVSDLRVRPGQLISPGEVVLSLQGDDQALSIVAAFPGHYRPLIHLGMPIRLELQGYRYAYQELRVDAVTDEVFGPQEARRLLGPGGEAIPLNGPVVLVFARLPSSTFESDGRSYDYHDGILGRAEIKVRSEGILTTLIPALEGLMPSSRS